MEIRYLEGDFGFFSARLDADVLHIRFRKNLLDHLADLSKRNMVAAFAQKVSQSERIKVILLNSDFNETGCEAYTHFFLEKNPVEDNLSFHKLCNITSQLVLNITSSERIVIHACQGNVISLFLNVSLACDYRIAADNTMFCNPYLNLGLIPLGAGPYFLSRLMGTGKIWETLLLKNDISAQEALELGLVDQVVPSTDLETTATDIARKFAHTHSGTMASLKKLINFSRNDLKAYFEIEKQEMLKLMNSEDFSRRYKQ